MSKILLLDDEVNILQAFRRVLRREGYELCATVSPAEALEWVAQEPFAVVVSDQRMPEMSGTEFLEQVRHRAPDTIRMILTGYADVQAAMDAINRGGVYRYLEKPWNDDALRHTLQQAVAQYELVQENRRLQALTERQNAELQDLNQNLKKKVLERTWEVVQLSQRMEQSFLGTVQAMARLTEMHSKVVGHHARRVAALSKAVGLRLGLSGKALLQVEIGAALHDIGKMHVDAELLRKPAHGLKKIEHFRIRMHVIHGHAILSEIPHLEEAALLVRHHHERYDGSGYPDALRGEEIPLGARIIAAVDAYDNALNSRDAFDTVTPPLALGQVRGQAGTYFDPAVVEALADIVEEAGDLIVQEVAVAVGVRDLEPGLVLAKDVRTQQGDVLLPKGCVLQMDHVERLLTQDEADPIEEEILVFRQRKAPRRPAIL